MAKLEELLGYTAFDKVTGFTGVITGCVHYLTGCNQVLLVPKVAEDGSFKEAQWFDVQRVTTIPVVERIVLENSETPGPDKVAPKR